MARNMGDYENVKARKLRFYEAHTDGRIVVYMVAPDKVTDYALFKAEVYRSPGDQAKCLPLGSGYAHEIRDKQLSKSNNGKEYASVNYTSWVENCEESAVGRALDNAGYASNMKCSREEIEKADRQGELLQKEASMEESKIIANVCKEALDGEVDPGEYMFSFGSYVNNKINELGEDQLKNYLAYMEKQTNVTSDFEEARAAVKNYLNVV